MQTLDIDCPEMPDLQFVLLVAALCTSGLTQCNVPEVVRATIFDRCWMLIHEGPPPTKVEERALELRAWTEVTLDAMLETIRSVLRTARIRTLAWEHPLSETIHSSTAAIQPPIERLQLLYPPPTDVAGRGPDALTGHNHPFL
ncbi:MAG: hypothetical protein ABI945_02520 [Nitrospirales bacterium]